VRWEAPINCDGRCCCNGPREGPSVPTRPWGSYSGRARTPAAPHLLPSHLQARATSGRSSLRPSVCLTWSAFCPSVSLWCSGLEWKTPSPPSGNERWAPPPRCGPPGECPAAACTAPALVQLGCSLGAAWVQLGCNKECQKQAAAAAAAFLPPNVHPHLSCLMRGTVGLARLQGPCSMMYEPLSRPVLPCACPLRSGAELTPAQEELLLQQVGFIKAFASKGPTSMSGHDCPDPLSPRGRPLYSRTLSGRLHRVRWLGHGPAARRPGHLEIRGERGNGGSSGARARACSRGGGGGGLRGVRVLKPRVPRSQPRGNPPAAHLRTMPATQWHTGGAGALNKGASGPRRVPSKRPQDVDQLLRVVLGAEEVENSTIDAVVVASPTPPSTTQEAPPSS
jgi:hypothetical protein